MPEPPAVFGAHYAANVHDVMTRLRGEGPAGQARTAAGRLVWVLTRDRDVRAAFLDRRLVISRGRPADTPPPRRAIDVTLMHENSGTHARLRRIAGAALAPHRVAVHRPRIEAIASDLLDGINTRQVDLLAAFARPFPFRVLCAVFGVPANAQADLYRWMSSVFDRAGRDRADLETGLDGIEAFVLAEVRRRRAAPGADLISALTSTWAAGRAEAEYQLVSLCATLMLAGFDSTIHMIGICLLGILSQPTLLARLVADPALVPRAVEELMRWDTPGVFGTPRLATEDIAYGETLVPANSVVLLGIASANRDPSRYGRPAEIDIDRPRPRHLSLGLGPHHCLGAALARLELAVAVAALLRRFPRMTLAVAPERLGWRGNHTYRRLAALPVTLG